MLDDTSPGLPAELHDLLCNEPHSPKTYAVVPICFHCCPADDLVPPLFAGLGVLLNLDHALDIESSLRASSTSPSSRDLSSCLSANRKADKKAKPTRMQRYSNTRKRVSCLAESGFKAVVRRSIVNTMAASRTKLFSRVPSSANRRIHPGWPVARPGFKRNTTPVAARQIENAITSAST